MAKVDTDNPFFLNPQAFLNLKTEKKEDKKTKNIRQGAPVFNRDFSKVINELNNADAAGNLNDLPPTEETIDYLMDEVRSTGDALKMRPVMEEVMRYKQAVRNFINHVVKNCYTKEYDSGIKNKYKPQFKERRETPAADDRNKYVKIQVIDDKLEALAAMLLSGQKKQLEIISRLEEIRGLLVDLLQ